jgi:hypothetical protein
MTTHPLLDAEFYETPETRRSPRAWHVYALIDPRDQLVRYVGWAYNPTRRLQDHLDEARRKETHKAQWIRQLIEFGLKPSVVVLETGTGVWGDAERRWIAKFVTDGADLTNITPGGEGVPGPRSPQALANIRAAARSRKPFSLTPDGRRRRSEATATRNRARRGVALSQEVRAALSAIHKARLSLLTPTERRERVRRALELRPPDYNKGWKHSAESKTKIGAANKKHAAARATVRQ